MVWESLERCRLRTGLSLQESAVSLGITSAELASYERGEHEPDALMLKHMALVYGCTADELLGLGNIDESN